MLSGQSVSPQAKPDDPRSRAQGLLVGARRAGDRRAEANQLLELGDLADDLAEARARFEQALAIAQALGDGPCQVRALRRLGGICATLGFYRQARRYLEQGALLAREAADAAALASCLAGLGRVQLALDDEAAEATLDESRRLAAAQDSAAEAACWLALGQAALARGELSLASSRIEQACALERERGSPGALALALAWLGETQRRQGNLEAARQASDAAIVQLDAVKPGERQLPAQDVWWLRYHTLGAPTTSGAPAGEAAWAALEQAREAMLARAAGLGEQALRRSYLNHVAINNAIVTEWARQLALRAGDAVPEAPDTPEGLVGESESTRGVLRRVLDIGLQMNALREPARLFEFIVDQLVELTGAERGMLVLNRPDGGEELLARGMRGWEEKLGGSLRATVLNAAAQSLQPILLHDALVDEVGHGSLIELHLRSVLCVPIQSGSQLRGLLYADSRAIAGRFGQDDVDLLAVFATQAGAAIESAQLHQEALRANSELETWARTLEQRVAERTNELQRANLTLSYRAAQLAISGQVARQLTAILDLEELLMDIVRRIQLRFGYYNASIWLLTPARDAVRLLAFAGAQTLQLSDEHQSLPLGGPGIIPAVAVSGQARRVGRVAEAPDFLFDHGAPATEAELALPLRRGDSVIGVLDIQSERPEAFNDDDQQMLQLLADQISVAIENARLYREMQEARDAAEAANAAKSQFLANMSHELRTPLNAIIGYSEILGEDALDRGQADLLPDLERIAVAGRHLLALINDILDISKIEAGRMELLIEPFDLPALVHEVAAQLLPAVQKQGNTLALQLAPELGHMHSDRAKVGQSLLNLLANAAKFTENGHIGLRAYPERAAGAGWVVIEVEDTGIGISEEQRARLFQPFTQADASTTRKYGGSGLGLALTRRFCQLLGGDVEVRSELGRGSTFSIRIPLEIEPAVPKSDEEL
jgi:signal transduction histidine kinase